MAETGKLMAGKRGVVFGPMAQVVHDSLQYITEADTQAMAVYLKSLATAGRAHVTGDVLGAVRDES